MVHDKVNILADKTHNTDRLCKSKREDGIYINGTHQSMQNINLSPDWFHDDYELQVGSLFNCCYVWYVVYDCKRSKKDMAECPRRQNPDPDFV